MADTYVLIHGSWHTGADLEAVADHMRRLGHIVHCPTIAGNRVGDDRSRVGLDHAISSIAQYIETNELSNIRLAGHSYGTRIGYPVIDPHHQQPDETLSADQCPLYSYDRLSLSNLRRSGATSPQITALSPRSAVFAILLPRA